MNLVLDFGNTKVKYAYFRHRQLVKTGAFSHLDWEASLARLLAVEKVSALVISTVVDLDPLLLKSMTPKVPQLLMVAHDTPMPFENRYQSKPTLGVDRLVLVAQAALEFPKRSVLVIDMGTCITYDFKNDQNQYIGGSISPGVQMRYHAVHHQTDALPKLTPKESSALNLMGTDTHSCIHSGIMKGVLYEVESFIAAYTKRYKDIAIVLTGGDIKYLSNHIKSSIFARPYFLLEGLYGIFVYQENYV